MSSFLVRFVDGGNPYTMCKAPLGREVLELKTQPPGVIKQAPPRQRSCKRTPLANQNEGNKSAVLSPLGSFESVEEYSCQSDLTRELS